MGTESFWAFYEDAAKVETAAKARGFSGNDGLQALHEYTVDNTGIADDVALDSLCVED